MQAARIEFDYPVELGLASVLVNSYSAERTAPLLRAVADTEHPARPARKLKA